eukprot:2543606-Pyramimonas_sp.AAC.1
MTDRNPSFLGHFVPWASKHSVGIIKYGGQSVGIIKYGVSRSCYNSPRVEYAVVRNGSATFSVGAVEWHP